VSFNVQPSYINQEINHQSATARILLTSDLIEINRGQQDNSLSIKKQTLIISNPHLLPLSLPIISIIPKLL
jgi:hypothetical protein